MSPHPHRRATSPISVLILLAAAASSLGFGACGSWGSPLFHFRSPLPRQLSLTGELGFELTLPRHVEPGSLEVRLVDSDGVTTPVAGVVIDGGRGLGSASGSVAIAQTGNYRLEAEVDARILFFFDRHLEAATSFETAALEHPDQCELFNNAECLLPFPSSRFLVPSDTPTGYGLEVPQVGIPAVNGPEIPASIANQLDGFSPTVQILMHFPGGVDLARSDASRLLMEGTSGPPFILTRAHDDRSLDPDSPTVLLDWDTGERILHWVEMDARAEGNPARQALILRPAASLIPGHRYIVAVRDLVHADGTPVEAEAPFAALRDFRPTDIPALAERRQHMEKVFQRLRRAGVRRRNLSLAFDFVVQSDHQLTRQMLSMRDQAFEWLEEQEQLGVQTFAVAGIEDYPNCAADAQVHRRIVRGTFQSPLFLTAVPTPNTVEFMNVDADDNPVRNGTMDAPFTISIPCAITLAGAQEGEARPEILTLLLGHGVFGRGEEMVLGIPEVATGVLSQFPESHLPDTNAWNYISGATDWTGWSSPDRLWVGLHIIGIGSSQLHNFEAFPDRHRQGQTNTLVLSRMMRRGLFNQDPAFQIDGEGVFPEEIGAQFYYGISMGGIQGLFHSAISPDIEHFGVDVPSMNFSLMLQRSTQFKAFEFLLATIGLVDPMKTLLGFGLLHEVWVAAEPAGYATHITSDPLPGSIPKKILMTPAWLDHQVPNQGTVITARTLGLANLHGSAQQELVGIPDGAPGQVLDSAYVTYDTGALDIFNPTHAPFIPQIGNEIVEVDKCDPHGARPMIPAGMQQLFAFLQPGGRVENFCDGICDADGPWEIAGGAGAPCNPFD